MNTSALTLMFYRFFFKFIYFGCTGSLLLCYSSCALRCKDFPGGPVVKNLPSNAGDMGSIPGQETKILLSWPA